MIGANASAGAGGAGDGRIVTESAYPAGGVAV
jgi:hypothetical protein